MSYIRQRMKDKSRTDIELTPLKAEIETVFNKRNIDEDCDTIANLLLPYRKPRQVCRSRNRSNRSARKSYLPLCRRRALQLFR